MGKERPSLRNVVGSFEKDQSLLKLDLETELPLQEKISDIKKDEVFIKLGEAFDNSISIIEQKRHSMFSRMKSEICFSFYDPDNKEKDLYTYIALRDAKSYEKGHKVTKPGWVWDAPEKLIDNSRLKINFKYGYFLAISKYSSENGVFEISYYPDEDLIKLETGDLTKYREIDFTFGCQTADPIWFNNASKEGVTNFLHQFAIYIEKKENFEPKLVSAKRLGGYTMGDEGT